MMRKLFFALVCFGFLLPGCGKGGIVTSTKGLVPPTDRPCADLKTGADMFGKWLSV